MVFIRLRDYLGNQAQELRTYNNVYALLKIATSPGDLASITLGPLIEKGPTAEHFHFDSGARLSFSITLRDSGGGSSLVAFRFHMQLPHGSSPEFLRFDLNSQHH